MMSRCDGGAIGRGRFMQLRYKTYPTASSAFGRFPTGAIVTEANMDNRHIRLAQAMKEAGVTAAEAHERWGWSRDTLKSNLSGTVQMGPKKAAEYAPKLRVRQEWLYYGTGPMREPPAPKGRPPISIPIFSWVSAGQLLDLGMDNIEALESVTVADLPQGEYFGTTVRGDSMDRVSPEGSTLIVRTDDRDLKDGQYYLFSLRGETTYKRYFGSPVQRLEPYSTNPANRTIFLDGDDGWQVVGRVYRTTFSLA